MRKVKFIIWMLVIFLLQTVCANYFQINTVKPDFVLGFVICVVVMEDSFKTAMLISVLSGVLAGALCGRNFTFMVLLYTYSSVILFRLRKTPRYLNDIWKVLGYTAIITIIEEVISYLILYYSVAWFTEAFFTRMLPAVVYNVIVVLIMYLPAKKTLFKSDGKKKLLIS